MSARTYPIYFDGKQGQIVVDPEAPAGFQVEFPDEKVQEAVAAHFRTPQTFRIPESQAIDDYREDTAVPIENITYFELALSRLYGKTGVSILPPA